jgi:hypothetical protein
MSALVALLAWCILFVLCWPLAWLISLPFRLLGIAFDAVFALLWALLMLPARVLGYRRAA